MPTLTNSASKSQTRKHYLDFYYQTVKLRSVLKIE